MSQDALAVLRATPYFQGLHPAALADLAARATERTYARGELILLEGERAHAVYLVVRGQVRAYKLSPEGRQQVLDRLGPGQSFNLVPVLDGLPNPASVEAVNQATVLALPAEVFRDLLRRHPAVAQAVLADLAGRVRRLATLVEDLSLRTVRARLARYLLRQAQQPGRRLTQAEMAAELGTVRDVIGRALADFEAEGLIAIDRHRIVVKNRRGLEERAQV